MKKLNKKGFSLVELIIVIAIMAVLIGVLAPTYLGQVSKSKRSTDLQNAQELATAIAVKAATDDAATSTSAITSLTTSITGGVSLPAIQAKASSSWYYEYDGRQVKIYILNDSKYFLVYPSVSAKDTTDATDSEWAK